MKYFFFLTPFLLFMNTAMGSSGKLTTITEFESAYINSRRVDIWLPPSYSTDKEQQFPVIYMHDGQNLFEDSLCGFGVEWGVDETITRLAAAGKIPECIVVGIWNTPKRYPEYQPEKPYASLNAEYREKLTLSYGQEPVSDNYLLFITRELKPFVDSSFRTFSEREHTFIMGSSMGGLISLYALCEYPETFAGAGCLSTHWVTRIDYSNGEMARVMQEYLREYLPAPTGHKIYFDYGTEELDAYYEPHQLAADRIMEEKGYERDVNWVSLKFEGASHNEIYWQQRLHIPLEFLLGELITGP